MKKGLKFLTKAKVKNILEVIRCRLTNFAGRTTIGVGQYNKTRKTFQHTSDNDGQLKMQYKSQYSCTYTYTI